MAFQPINAAFRGKPAKRDTKRISWEIIHRSVALATLTLAAVAIFYGIEEACSRGFQTCAYDPCLFEAASRFHNPYLPLTCRCSNQKRGFIVWIAGIGGFILLREALGPFIKRAITPRSQVRPLELRFFTFYRLMLIQRREISLQLRRAAQAKMAEGEDAAWERAERAADVTQVRVKGDLHRAVEVAVERGLALVCGTELAFFNLQLLGSFLPSAKICPHSNRPSSLGLCGCLS